MGNWIVEYQPFGKIYRVTIKDVDLYGIINYNQCINDPESGSIYIDSTSIISIKKTYKVIEIDDQGEING